MKSMILGAILTLMSASALAQSYQACYCVELQRRVSGLEYLASYGPLSGWERNQVQNDINYGYDMMNRAQYAQSTEEANGICSQGNVGVDREWVRWQPWIAQHGADRGNYCY
jgi:hypothetical protein